MAVATLLILLVLLAIHLAIHRGLRAPRLPVVETPRRLGLPQEDVSLAGARGRRLAAWFIPAPQPGPAPAVLVLHGWGANRSMMLPLARPLHEAGHALLFLDARCHGDSDGDTFASLPRFAEDMEAGLAWLRAERRVDIRRITLLGHSVGAAAALLVASRQPNIAAVVSVAAFSHPRRVMGLMLAAWHVPMMPLGYYILWYVQKVIGHRYDDIAPITTIARVPCPVLLVHGTEDETVPLSDAEAIWQQRGSLPGAFLAVPGSHDSYHDLEARLPEVVAFLAQTEAAGSGGVLVQPAGFPPASS